MARLQTKLTVPIEITEAVGYIRVSTQDQADSGLGLEVQRRKIQAYCDASGWELIAIHEDAGVSAKTLNRPAYKAAINNLRPGRALVTLKLDRLTRSVKDLYTFTDAVQSAGAEWATVMEKYDTTTASGRMILGLIATINQWEREVIAERTIAALAVKSNNNERLGTTPLGYETIIDDSGTSVLQMRPDEMETVKIIRGLYSAGLSFRKIVAELVKANIPTKRGGKWHPNTVKKICEQRYVERISNA